MNSVHYGREPAGGDLPDLVITSSGKGTRAAGRASAGGVPGAAISSRFFFSWLAGRDRVGAEPLFALKSRGRGPSLSRKGRRWFSSPFPPSLIALPPARSPFSPFLSLPFFPDFEFLGPTRDKRFGGRKEDGDKDDEGEEMEMKQTMQMRGLLLLLPALWALFSRDFRAVTGKEIPLLRVPSRPRGRQPTLDLIFTGSCPFHALPPA